MEAFRRTIRSENPALLTLWGGEFTARMAESVFQIALLWYLLEITQSSLATGLVTMVIHLPALLVVAWAGVLVDRWPLRRTLLGSNLARVLLAAALFFAALGGGMWGVGVLAFLLTSASAFFNPARDAVIPLLTPPSGLLGANSLVQSAWQFSLLLGPFLAAAALPFVAAGRLFGLVALGYLVSLGLLAWLPATRRAAPQSPPAEGRVAVFRREFRAGWGALRQHRPVFAIWIITVFNNFFLMGPVIVGVPFYVKAHLGGTASDYALVEGTYAGGMIISSWLIARFGGRFPPVRTLMAGMVYDGLTYLPLLWVTTVEGTLFTIFVHSLGIPTITISRLTALHRMVPSAVQGRVFSFFHLAVAGMTALSIGVVGMVLIWLPANFLFAAIGLLSAACGAVGLALPVLRRA